MLKRAATLVADMFKRMFRPSDNDVMDAKIKAQLGIVNNTPFNPARFTGKSKTFKKNQRVERAKSAKRAARRKGQV